jgi:hypothetical protein
MITVGDKLVTEVRHEWVVYRPDGQVIVLDEQDYDEAEARMVSEIEDGQLYQRCLYVMEAEPV